MTSSQSVSDSKNCETSSLCRPAPLCSDCAQVVGARVVVLVGMQTSVVKSTVDDSARTRGLQFSSTVSVATTISTQFPIEGAATDNDAFQQDCTEAALANDIGQALTCRSTSILMSANILSCNWCQWWCYSILSSDWLT